MLYKYFLWFKVKELDIMLLRRKLIWLGWIIRLGRLWFLVIRRLLLLLVIRLFRSINLLLKIFIMSSHFMVFILLLQREVCCIGQPLRGFSIINLSRCSLGRLSIWCAVLVTCWLIVHSKMWWYWTWFGRIGQVRRCRQMT